jgi:cellobiose phosphorylase
MSLKGKYGYFDPEETEYVITRPDTPRPWLNYLMNDTYVAMISNTAGGVSYDTDPRVYRLLRYRYQNLPYDRPGRYVYVRDNESKEYWSSTWAPVHMPLKECSYTCRVGTGYTIISMCYNGIRTEIRYFVPLKGKLEIWDLTVTNESGNSRRLSTFSYAEFAWWGAMRDLMNMDNGPNVSRQYYDAPTGSIIHNSYNDIGTGLHNMIFVQNYGFHTSSSKPRGYSGDRDHFVGRYRDESNPLVVERGKSSNLCRSSGVTLGSLEHRFTLRPGQSKRIVYRTGMGPEKDACFETIRMYRTPASVDRAFRDLRGFWKEKLGRFQVRTPDKEFNALVNGFVQYQSAVTMRLSRSISSYEWGISRSIGFRDSSQDQIGLCHAFPDTARTMLGHLMSAIHEDGSACHNFNPLTDEWGPNEHHDNHNWLALTVSQYIKETGDEAFLKEKFPYTFSKRKGSAFDHLRRANDYAWKLRGNNGLMQMGAADWNDALNPANRDSESMFTSALYCVSTLALIEIAERLGETRYVSTLKNRYRSVKRKMNDVGWDGRWYRRFINSNGDILGTSKAPKSIGRLFLEPQPWAVFAGIATGSRALQVLDNTEKMVGTAYGHKLMDRPFTYFDMDAHGSVAIQQGGVGMNGSVFSHASTWMISAETYLGRGDKAMEYFKRMCAATKNRIADRHECEPYVIAQWVSQPPFHTPGRARNSWLSGSAAWMAIGSLQRIIGCRPDFNGLIVDPCIPPEWEGFSMTRVFRGVRYNIDVTNPDGVSRGIRSLSVNGEEVKGEMIPYRESDRGKTVQVNLVMGK